MSDIASVDSNFIDDTVMEGIEDLVNELKVKDNSNHMVETASVKTIRNSDKVPTSPSPHPENKTPKPEDNWSKSSGKTGNNLDFLNASKPDTDQFPTYIDDEIKSRLSVKSYNSKKSSRDSIKSNTTVRRLKLLEEWETLCKKNRDYDAKQFTIESHTRDIELEIKKIKFRNKRERWINIMGTVAWLIAKVIEMGINKISPDDNKPMLGWANHIKNSIKEFEDDFSDLYAKYSSSGKESPPEVRIIFGLLISGIQFAFINQAPRMIASMINSNRQQSSYHYPMPPGGGHNKQPPPQSVFASQMPVTNMTGPDFSDDPELAELLADAQDRAED